MSPEPIFLSSRFFCSGSQARLRRPGMTERGLGPGAQRLRMQRPQFAVLADARGITREEVQV